MSRKELKFSAKQQISGNVFILFLMNLISNCAFIGTLVNSFILTIILTYVAGAPLRISLSRTYLDLVTDDKKPEFDTLGFGFKKCWTQSVLLTFWSGLYVFLWSLLLIVPGIVKAYSYAMAHYIMAENPEIKALDAMKKSEKMMDGHKWDLFVFDLSFILWNLLVMITFGIAVIYVGPYIETSKANYYLKLKELTSENVVSEEN